jgi:aminopeptidase N
MRGKLFAGILAAGALLGAGTALAATFVAGSDGLGDPFFPQGGNGGYDVQHYGLTLDYDPPSNHLAGTAVVTAKATQALSRFDLDFRGKREEFRATSVLVNGVQAAAAQEGQELVITPAAGIPVGRTFTVTVSYAGTPQVVTDPDQSIEGWVPTDDGAVAVGEPQGSPGWFPCNDNPRDKATYDISVTVPAGLTAMSNGVLLSSSTAAGRTTWAWREAEPMTTYLTTVEVGKFDLTISNVDGIRSYVAVDPQLAKGQVLAKLPDAIRYYSSIYGPYPFSAVGAIVDSAKNLGYSLETQTKPLFPYVPDEATLVHELSHQWFGDSVTLATWPDIWLHEGFATFSEWIWSEHAGNKSAAQSFKELYAKSAKDDAFWNPPPGNPGTPALLFNGTIYYRGGMALEALREKIGNDATFFKIMRDYAQENRLGNATTATFQQTAERDSGLDLGTFFQAWLYTPGKPTSW